MGKKLAMIIGVVFVLVGLLGFVSNPIVGGGSALFMTNTAHNLAHILIGVIMMVMAAQGESSALLSLKIFGVVYLLLAVLGFVMTSPMFGIIAYNGADNWLHLVLGVVLLALGMKKASSAMPSSPSMPSGM